MALRHYSLILFFLMTYSVRQSHAEDEDRDIEINLPTLGGAPLVWAKGGPLPSCDTLKKIEEQTGQKFPASDHATCTKYQLEYCTKKEKKMGKKHCYDGG